MIAVIIKASKIFLPLRLYLLSRYNCYKCVSSNEYCSIILSLWQHDCFWVGAAEPGRLVFVSGVHSGVKWGFPSRTYCVRICYLHSSALWEKVSLFCCCTIQSAVSQAALQLRGQVWLAPCQECVFGEHIYGEVWLSWLFFFPWKASRGESQ